MTLDEAIKHAEGVAEQSEEDAKAWVREGWQGAFKDLNPEKEAEFFTERVKLSDGCAKCAKEYRQLAEWLKELRELRERKRPHGAWIFDNPTGCWYCSNCKREPKDQDYMLPFCAWCGADMRKKEGEVDDK